MFVTIKFLSYITDYTMPSNESISIYKQLSTFSEIFSKLAPFSF